MAALIKAIDGIGRAFDYSALPKDVAGEAQRIAIMVRARHKEQIKAVVETGRDLTTIKGKLAHGQFMPWLEAEFGWSERTAQNYMAAAATFQDKTAIVADLPLTTVYALSAPSTPEPVRAAIVGRLEAGERVNADEIRNLIADRKKQDKTAQKAAKLTPAQRKARDQRERRRDALWQKERERRDEERAQRQTALDRLAVLIVQISGDNLDTVVALAEQAHELSLLQAIMAAKS